MDLIVVALATYNTLMEPNEGLRPDELCQVEVWIPGVPRDNGALSGNGFEDGKMLNRQLKEQAEPNPS